MTLTFTIAFCLYCSLPTLRICGLNSLDLKKSFHLLYLSCFHFSPTYVPCLISSKSKTNIYWQFYTITIKYKQWKYNYKRFPISSAVLKLHFRSLGQATKKNFCWISKNKITSVLQQQMLKKQITKTLNGPFHKIPMKKKRSTVLCLKLLRVYMLGVIRDMD